MSTEATTSTPGEQQAPPAHWPPLLCSATALVGRFGNIDDRTAALLTLAVVGALAGPVGWIVPGVGVFTPAISAIITAPDGHSPVTGAGPRLALAALTEQFENRLLMILKEHRRLSDGRLLAQEIRRTETVLRSLRDKSAGYRRTLDRVAAGDLPASTVDAMEAKGEYRLLKPDEDHVEAMLAGLRLMERPMILLPFAGPREIADWDRRAYDGYVFELATEPGTMTRLRTLGRNDLQRVCAFRRNMGWGSRVGYGDGRLRPKPGLSSLWVVEEQELEEALGDPLLGMHHFFDPFVLVEPQVFRPEGWEMDDQHEDRWVSLCSTLIDMRFVGDTAYRGPSPEARQELGTVWHGLAEPLFSHLIKLTLCSALIRDPVGGITVDDVRTALDLVNHVEEPTRKLWVAPVAGDALRDRQPAARSLDTFLQKLARHGPCSRRTLARTYDKCDYEALEEMINRAKELGVVAEDGEGKIRLVGVGASVEQGS
jgi:hypothetical protein